MEARKQSLHEVGPRQGDEIETGHSCDAIHLLWEYFVYCLEVELVEGILGEQKAASSNHSFVETTYLAECIQDCRLCSLEFIHFWTHEYVDVVERIQMLRRRLLDSFPLLFIKVQERNKLRLQHRWKDEVVIKYQFNLLHSDINMV